MKKANCLRRVMAGVGIMVFMGLAYCIGVMVYKNVMLYMELLDKEKAEKTIAEQTREIPNLSVRVKIVFPKFLAGNTVYYYPDGKKFNCETGKFQGVKYKVKEAVLEADRFEIVEGGNYHDFISNVQKREHKYYYILRPITKLRIEEYYERSIYVRAFEGVDEHEHEIRAEENEVGEIK